jgi:hypothetical protein
LLDDAAFEVVVLGVRYGLGLKVRRRVIYHLSTSLEE